MWVVSELSGGGPYTGWIGYPYRHLRNSLALSVSDYRLIFGISTPLLIRVIVLFHPCILLPYTFFVSKVIGLDEDGVFEGNSSTRFLHSTVHRFVWYCRLLKLFEFICFSVWYKVACINFESA